VSAGTELHRTQSANERLIQSSFTEGTGCQGDPYTPPVFQSWGIDLLQNLWRRKGTGHFILEFRCVASFRN